MGSEWGREQLQLLKATYEEFEMDKEGPHYKKRVQAIMKMDRKKLQAEAAGGKKARAAQAAAADGAPLERARAARQPQRPAAAAESASAMKNTKEKRWNGTNWCDGICSAVKGASLMMSNMFMLCFGMVPTANGSRAWKMAADWGLGATGQHGGRFGAVEEAFDGEGALGGALGHPYGEAEGARRVGRLEELLVVGDHELGEVSGRHLRDAAATPGRWGTDELSR